MFTSKVLVMSERSDEMRSVWKAILTYLKLQIENIRLVSTEKSAILMSTAVVAAILGILLAFALFFISIGLVLLLATVLPVFWCFMIMGGIYILVGVGVYLMRTTLVTDPIARFLSRLFLDEPAADKNNHKTV